MQLIKKITNNKKALIFASLILLLVVFFYIRQNNNGTGSTNPESTANQLVFDRVPQAEKIEINGVEMNNFMRESTHSPGLKLFIISASGNFEIQYYNSFNLFLITIQSTPFFQKRILAENEFLTLLNVSKEDACKLNVNVSTPRHINPYEAGEIYGLSFCQ